MICPICRKPCHSTFIFCSAHNTAWMGSTEAKRAVADSHDTARYASMLADFATRARAEGL